MYWQDIVGIATASYTAVSLTTLKILIAVNFHHSRKLRKKLAQRLLKETEYDALLAKKIEIEKMLERDRALKEKAKEEI